MACAVPFLRRDLGSAGSRAAAVCFAVVLLVAAPFYVRNAGGKAQSAWLSEMDAG